MSTRTNIRNATATALTSALVVPTANILRGRNNTIASVSFPSAAVYAVTEQIEVRTLGPSNRTQYRQLQLVVDSALKIRYKVTLSKYRALLANRAVNLGFAKVKGGMVIPKEA